MKIEVDIKGVEATTERIEEGIWDGMEATADSLMEDAEDTAQDVLSDTRRIWNREVYHGFVTNQDRDRAMKEVNARMANMAPHATVVERGADYGMEGPPVTALIPWVAAHWGGTGRDPTGPDSNDHGSASGGSAGDDWSVKDDPFGPKSARELHEDHGAESDWAFSKEPGWEPKETYPGQKVVLYDEKYDEYVENEVDYAKDWDTVYFEDGRQTDNTRFPYAVVAYESWDDLTEQEKLDAIRKTFDNVDRDASFSPDTNSLIDKTLDDWVEKTNNLERLRNMSTALREFRYKKGRANMDDKIGSSDRTNLVNLPNLSETPDLRETINHETWHSFVQGNGLDHPQAAVADHLGPGPYGWSQKHYFEDNLKNNPNVLYNYFEQGFENFGNDPNKNEWAHPMTYGLLPAKERANTGEHSPPDYDPFDHWGEHIYKSTVDEGSSDELQVNWDPGAHANYVFDPDSGLLQKNAWLQLENDDGDLLKTRVLSDLVERPKGEWRDKISDKMDQEGESTMYGVKVQMIGGEHWLPIDTDNDEIWMGNFDFKKYAHPDDVVQPSNGSINVPDDPGFLSNDEWEQFTEGMNRALFRMQMGSEMFDAMRSRRKQVYVNNSQYHVLYGHETISGFGELWFARSKSETGIDTDYTQAIIDLYENHPLYVFSGAKNVEPSQFFKDVLRDHTGLDWDEILRDLDPDFEVP